MYYKINNEIIYSEIKQDFEEISENDYKDQIMIKLKNSIINNLNIMAYNQIIAVYPIYRQINISNLSQGYTEIDKNNMIAFIENIRNINREKIEIINAINNIEELKKLEF